jgi:hypothetical protein
MARVTNAIWENHIELIERIEGLDDFVHEDTMEKCLRETKEYGGILSCNEAPTFFKPPMHSHPETDIACNDDLYTLAKEAINSSTAFQSNALDKDSYHTLVSLWTAANSLKLLHRFTHERQPYLTRRALPSGVNLVDNNFSSKETKELVAEWLYYRT